MMASSGETILRLQDGLRFVATTPSGFELTLDSRVERQEVAAGPSPMEVQLVALGSCTAMDTISILRKMREDVIDYSVRLTHTRAKDHPKVYTAVQIEHRFRGNGVREGNVRRAIALTMTRYCPVFAMLFPKVAITERFEIVDESTGNVLAGEASAQDALAPEPT
jgi:putative redox protein